MSNRAYHNQHNDN